MCSGIYNTSQGKKCEFCQPLFVGEARNNGTCISCFSACNHSANVCMDREDLLKARNGSLSLDPEQVSTLAGLRRSGTLFGQGMLIWVKEILFPPLNQGKIREVYFRGVARGVRGVMAGPPVPTLMCCTSIYSLVRPSLTTRSKHFSKDVPSPYPHPTLTKGKSWLRPCIFRRLF